MVELAPNTDPAEKTLDVHFLSAVSVSWSSLMDLTDPSAYGSIQPFPVVGILAYKADTDNGADKPQAG